VKYVHPKGNNYKSHKKHPSSNDLITKKVKKADAIAKKRAKYKLIL